MAMTSNADMIERLNETARLAIKEVVDEIEEEEVKNACNRIKVRVVEAHAQIAANLYKHVSAYEHNSNFVI